MSEDSFLTRFSNWYYHVSVELADPRTNDWFLVKHPWILFICAYYAYWVKIAGPRWMRNREAFQLKWILVIYNFLQVLVSIYLVKIGVDYGWFNGYSFRCQPVDYSNDPKALLAADACFWYYMAKISELLDTIFFVLRKKQKQITLLHVYHHTMMPAISWGATKYYPGGHGTFIGFVNSITHIIMYFYYMLAAMGPEYQKYLWWKKYITTFQLIQFSLIFVHAMQLFVIECDFPKWIALLVVPNAIFLCYLFSDFYKKAYSATRRHVEAMGMRTKSESNASSAVKAPSAESTVNHKLTIGFSLKRRNKRNVS